MNSPTHRVHPESLRPIAVILGFLLAPGLVFAAPNTVTGNIGGAAVTPDTFTVSGTQLTLVKTAFLATTGAPINSGDTVPKGTRVKFLVFINNSTSVGASDVTAQDVLPADLVYNAATMKASLLNNSAATWCPGGTCNRANIFNEVNTNGTAVGDGDSVTPPNDADVASYTVATTTLDFGNGNNANNSQLDVTADSVWAVIFTVTVN